MYVFRLWYFGGDWMNVYVNLVIVGDVSWMPIAYLPRYSGFLDIHKLWHASNWFVHCDNLRSLNKIVNFATYANCIFFNLNATTLYIQWWDSISWTITTQTETRSSYAFCTIALSYKTSQTAVQKYFSLIIFFFAKDIRMSCEDFIGLAVFHSKACVAK
jgi:hypothetical protein